MSKKQHCRIKIYYTSLTGQSNKIKSNQTKAFLILDQKQWSLQKIDVAYDKKSVQFVQAFKEYGYELPLIFIDDMYIGDGDKLQELEDNQFLDEIYDQQYLERCLLCNMDRKSEDQKQCSDCKQNLLFFRVI
ncbi:unnamed protein product (macronuclear) [Paramecium tetraurelia]|uniref:Uncharacterized protein n=1 Tax=Paramecium tetraurelia TaxID=5888 RepID=A0BLB5_PARTE|nr:uncharacterized protein GSPATT00029964001 [Paramecium tetraurelia]CAK59332.1 unnamed protein product [Paramecium tetraurelia]|eukprot:XP_001426730.1 hypothetical protein (macronuclear) [Paramecium tetraurelia strain d4-2]